MSTGQAGQKWARQRLEIPARVLLAIGGGYALSAALVLAVAAALPPMTGLARGEAVVLAAMLGFLLYLGLLLWAFAPVRLRRVALWLGGVPTLAWGWILWVVPSAFS